METVSIEGFVSLAATKTLILDPTPLTKVHKSDFRVSSDLLF